MHVTGHKVSAVEHFLMPTSNFTKVSLTAGRPNFSAAYTAKRPGAYLFDNKISMGDGDVLQHPSLKTVGDYYPEHLRRQNFGKYIVRFFVYQRAQGPHS